MKVKEKQKNRTFSVNLPEDLVKEIESVAAQKRWSRNQTISVLLEECVEGYINEQK